MKTLHQILLVCFLVIFTSACSTAPNSNAKENKSNIEVNTEDTQSPSRVEELSSFESTTISTSNGEIEISPTVVATTDRATTEQSGALEPKTEYADPLETINRSVFAFNHLSYKYVLIPLAKGYNKHVPEPAQSSISSVFSNIREPLNLVNNALTGEIDEAGANLGRFVVNTTVGLLGLFDPAKAWFGIEKNPQSVAQTLQKWGLGSGAYVVIPFLGPSDVRGLGSTVTESIFHPTGYILESPDSTIIRVIDGFEDFTSKAELYEVLYQNADDPYIYFRNQHIQNSNRDELANDKEVKEVNLVTDESNE